MAQVVQRPVAGPRQPPSVGEVLTFLLSRQSTSRREIAEHTGLSPAAVSRALQPMLAAGLVSEQSLPREAGHGAGRPTQRVRIVAQRVTALGVKVAATELIAVVTNLAGVIIDEFHLPLPGTGTVVDVDDVISGIAEVIERLSVRHRLDQVGVAIPGDVDTDRGRVALSPLLGWRQVDFADRLATAIDHPVIVENDVRALTVAERSFGDAFGIDNFAVVTVGEGVGCGLVIDGRVHRGAFGVAGELGHMIIDTSGGADRQVEQLISRSAIARRAAMITERVPAPTSFAELIAAAQSADPGARQLLQAVGRQLAAGIANVINLVGPQRLVISSEGFDLDDAFGAELDRGIRRYAFGRAARVEIIHREIPFTEWARGAAVVALNEQVAQAC